MPSNPEIPEAAVGRAMNGHPESWRETIESSLQAAAPIIRAQERERLKAGLFSDEAARAAWEIGRLRIESSDRDKPFPRWRGMLRAAFAAIDQLDDSDA